MGLSRAGLQMRQMSVARGPAMALAALVLVTLLLYRDTVASLVGLWTDPGDPTYHHGLVLVGICAFLFCRRWSEAAGAMQERPSLSASVLILLTSFGWLLATLGDVLIVQQLSLLLLIGLLVVSVVGYRNAWGLAFPVALLIFAMPVWEPLSPYLQRLTVSMVTFLVNLSGIPAVHEGIRISVPAGTFDVEPSCSGISQLIVGTMAGMLFAFTNRPGRKAAICVVAAAVVISILVNTLRVYTVVIAGQLTGMRHYFVAHHWTLGWLLFGVAMFVFLLVVSRLIHPRGDAPSLTSAPVTRSVVTENKAAIARNALLSFGALLVGPALVFAYQSDRGEIGRLTLDLPAEIAGWRAATVPSGSYRPVFHNPDLEHEVFFSDAEGRRVYLYVAEYVYQQQGKEAVYYLNSVYDDKAWKPLSTTTQRLGTGASVEETRIESRTGAQKLVWKWYYVDGFAVSSAYMAKLLNAWGALKRDPSIAVVVVATDLEGSEESAGASLTRFVTDTRQAVEHAIDHIHIEQSPSRSNPVR